jgi:hypothetical protein
MTADYNLCERRYHEAFSDFSLTPPGLRYLQVRTLIDREPLLASADLRRRFQITTREINRETIETLRRKIFADTTIREDDLEEWLRRAYHEVKAKRGWNIAKLKASLYRIRKEGDEYWEAWNSIYRDDIRAHIQHRFVRTNDIQDYEELRCRIEGELNPTVRGYTIISWYNQWTSALIEYFILNHPQVVPAVRRINKVDFFFRKIPLDLKVTFVPQGYMTWLRRNDIAQNMTQVLKHVQAEPLTLARWLYENQGEARFSDSHRLFLVLCDEEQPEASWKLKADFDGIYTRLDQYFTSTDSLPTLDWQFKGQSIRGNYQTLTDVVLVTRRIGE